MRNPGCPGFRRLDEDEGQDYARLRLYVVYRLQHLEWLDAEPVTPTVRGAPRAPAPRRALTLAAQEREEARRRGMHCVIRRPKRRESAARVRGRAGGRGRPRRPLTRRAPPAVGPVVRRGR